MISSSHRPLPNNTQHSQQTDIHAYGGIRTHYLSRRAVVDLHLGPRGHWDRLSSLGYVKFPFSVAQLPNSGLGRLTVEVCGPDAHRHAHPVGIFRTRGQTLPQHTYTTHNKHNRRTLAPSEGFEPTIPADLSLTQYGHRDWSMLNHSV